MDTNIYINNKLYVCGKSLGINFEKNYPHHTLLKEEERFNLMYNFLKETPNIGGYDMLLEMDKIKDKEESIKSFDFLVF